MRYGPGEVPYFPLCVLLSFCLSMGAPDRDAPAGAAASAQDSRSPRNASYAMQVELDAEQRTLRGTQVLTWRNVTSRPTSELRYHVYYNGWRNDHSSWFRTGHGLDHDLAHVRDEQWAYSDVEKIELLGNEQVVDLTADAEYISPDDGNPHDRTVLRVPLPEAVQPGESVEVRLQWKAKVPRTFARTGVRGDYYFLAQWFPKVGVFEADGTWNCHQFIQTEFYADFGVYDVSLRVPTGWIVGATGRERERIDNGDGTTTHRYVQSDVHDFAWTTAPDFLVHERKFEHSGLPSVDMRLLLRPDHSGMADRYFEATAAALRWYGQWWGAYPYDHITIVDPAYASGTGGMEYPTLFTGGTRWLSPRARRSPEGVTVHEAGHQFWYGVVANNEFEHAWLDEGFNTYSTTRTMMEAFPEHHLVERYLEGFVPVVFRGVVPAERTEGADRHVGMASGLKRDPQAKPSWQTGPRTYRINAYDKGALTLRTLENYLGWPTFQKVMSAYYEAYAFGHPTPQDFFRVAETVSGRELGWFFDQAWGSTAVFDYSVGEVASTQIRPIRGWSDHHGSLELAQGGPPEDRWETEVHVRRWGDGVFPVTVEVVFEDGTRETEHWDGRDRWARYAFETSAQVERVRVDPDHALVLDVDYTNNGWLRDSQADAAATKWSSKWMVWVQATLEAFAFFA